MLDPELEPLLSQATALPYREMPVEEARRTMLETSQTMTCDVSLDSVVDHVAKLPGRDLPVRIYRPPDAEGATLVYFHGGGWVLGSVETHDAYCRSLAHAAGINVASVDYRLAPEHRFPAAADDAIDVTRWVRNSSQDLQLDASRIGVGGDSAGGNLAAVVAQTLREDDPPLACQLLIYPIVDCDTETSSYVENAEGYQLTRDTMIWFWEEYVPEASQRTDIKASPLRNRDLRGLPPALVVTAEYDPLRDEGEVYARRLADSGNDVELKRYDGMIHGFVRRQQQLKAARRSLELISQYLKRKLRT